MDARGRSGGLAIGWKEALVKAINLWGMESIIGLQYHALDLQSTFTVLNIYGPYLNRVTF